ncbi:MAG TPA: ABC transporter ATP-binding protein [Candidatus Hydrogenedentes bacterium]|nr:ABC transporter ATP-binding protein [Candidatus Hydrogenedentota bacterium]
MKDSALQTAAAPVGAQTAAAEVCHVTFAYERREDPVLRDISLTVRRGQCVTLVGPNGGGKTTLLKIMLGLLEPTVGSVSLLGGPPQKSRHRAGYVPQRIQCDALFPITVYEVVEMGLLNRPDIAGRGARRERVEQMLQTTGIAELSSRPFGSLSGGQQQRALIARALVSDPEILFLDEPTTAVDPASRAALLDLLDHTRQGRAMVLVTHDAETVERFIEAVYCVHRTIHHHPATRMDSSLLRHMTGGGLAEHD